MTDQEFLREIKRIDDPKPRPPAVAVFGMTLSVAWKRYEADCLEHGVMPRFASAAEALAALPTFMTP